MTIVAALGASAGVFLLLAAGCLVAVSGDWLATGHADRRATRTGVASLVTAVVLALAAIWTAALT